MTKRPTGWVVALVGPVVLATGLGVGAAPARHKPAAAVSSTAPLSTLWEEPTDLPDRDLFYGPWGRENAPDPQAVYTYLRPKEGGVNPGVIVRDPENREWHVKQSAADNTKGAEGPVEVVLSRVLSAIGYHQPPVYFLPSFRMQKSLGAPKTEPGGRFRLARKGLKDIGSWAWMNNPFRDTVQLRGLLLVLDVFNSSDLKNSNNTVYTVRDGDATAQWFVVRDLGTALGETGRLAPMRSNPSLLGKQPLIAGVSGGYLRFHYRGRHQELFDRRITPADAVWAGTLLSQLSDKQWHDAFYAGGYTPEVTDRFLTVIRARIDEALHADDAVTTSRARH